MAVRSWPPSSAIRTRPPARPVSSCVSSPKPANTQLFQSRNTSQHSTIMSEKCSGFHEIGYEMLTLGRDIVASKWRLVTLHCIEAGGHQNHIRTEMLGDRHHHIPVQILGKVKWCSFLRCTSERILHSSRESLELS